MASDVHIVVVIDNMPELKELVSKLDTIFGDAIRSIKNFRKAVEVYEEKVAEKQKLLNDG